MLRAATYKHDHQISTSSVRFDEQIARQRRSPRMRVTLKSTAARRQAHAHV